MMGQINSTGQKQSLPRLRYEISKQIARNIPRLGLVPRQRDKTMPRASLHCRRRLDFCSRIGSLAPSSSDIAGTKRNCFAT